MTSNDVRGHLNFTSGCPVISPSNDTTRFHDSSEESPSGVQCEAKTVIVIGECGEGKSSIVERVTGVTGLSSSSRESYTSVAQPFVTEDGFLRLVDTPGLNPLEDKLMHNLRVAQAFSYGSVSLLCLVIKAQPRLDTTLHRVRSMAIDWDFEDILTVWITHMDQVTWGQEECTRILLSRYGLDKVMFSSESSSGSDLSQQLLHLARQVVPMQIALDVDSQSFWNHFRLSDDHVEVLRSVRQEVVKCQEHLCDFQRFFDEMTMSEHPDVVRDLVFEFYAFMQEEIPRANKRLRDKHCFSSVTELTVLERGHLANLENQMKSLFHGIRVTMAAYHQDSVHLNLRRCPHCNVMWTQPRRRDGHMNCGLTSSDVRISAGLTRWSFEFTEVGRLKVAQVQHAKSGLSQGEIIQGCGRPMKWEEMKPVSLEEVNGEEMVGGGAMTVADVMRGTVGQGAPDEDQGATLFQQVSSWARQSWSSDSWRGEQDSMANPKQDILHSDFSVGTEPLQGTGCCARKRPKMPSRFGFGRAPGRGGS